MGDRDRWQRERLLKDTAVELTVQPPGPRYLRGNISDLGGTPAEETDGHLTQDGLPTGARAQGHALPGVTRRPDTRAQS